jgi:hypothetical protein
MRLNISLTLLLIWPLLAHAAADRIVRDGVEMRVSPRTPDQTTAFYSVRGFPPKAVEDIAQACFLGVMIHNRRSDSLLLELDNWRFTDAAGHEVKRITRPQWNARWQALDVPLAARATFGWTQLPESRDLLPDEAVGGNVPVEPPSGEFTLSARFRTGSGGEVDITVPDLSCPHDQEAP